LELPYNDAVILLPELPFQPENQIAAAYYGRAGWEGGWILIPEILAAVSAAAR
jgi:hypothetical protein